MPVCLALLAAGVSRALAEATFYVPWYAIRARSRPIISLLVVDSRHQTSRYERRALSAIPGGKESCVSSCSSGSRSLAAAAFTTGRTFNRKPVSIHTSFSRTFRVKPARKVWFREQILGKIAALSFAAEMPNAARLSAHFCRSNTGRSNRCGSCHLLKLWLIFRREIWFIGLSSYCNSFEVSLDHPICALGSNPNWLYCAEILKLKPFMHFIIYIYKYFFRQTNLRHYSDACKHKSCIPIFIFLHSQWFWYLFNYLNYW